MIFRKLKTPFFFLVSALLTYKLYRDLSPLDHPLIDDAGIILRYLDNFRNGYFYSYNPSDGPVFGISGFIHGVLAGSLAFLRVKPEVCLVISNLLGSFLFFGFAAMIFDLAYSNIFLSIFFAALLSEVSYFITATFFLGLEAPLHLSLVLLAIYLFMTKSRWLYPACALIIVSKLDAVGIAAVLITGDIFRRTNPASQDAGDRRQLFISALKGAVIYFGLPLLLWLAVSTAIFGSPLPQTFIAKNFYRAKGVGGFFPFLNGFRRDGWLGIATLIEGFSALIVLCAALLRRKWLEPAVLFYALGIAVLAQYFYYNPGELMAWYYTLPEVLFLMGLFLSPAFFLRAKASSRTLKSGMALGAVVMTSLCLFFARGRLVEGVMDYADRAEGEKIRIGRFVRKITPANGVVLTGFGHIAREAGNYVIDESGLNSRFATDHRLALEEMIQAGRPTAFIRNGLLTVDWQRRHGLRLAGSFYNIDLVLSAPAFRVFSLQPDGDIAEYVPPSHLSGCAVIQQGGFLLLKGNSFKIDLSRSPKPAVLRFGVATYNDPISLAAVGYEGSRAVSLGACDVFPTLGHHCENGCTSECVFNFRGSERFDRVSVTANDKRSFTAIEPVIQYPPGGGS